VHKLRDEEIQGSCLNCHAGRHGIAHYVVSMVTAICFDMLNDQSHLRTPFTLVPCVSDCSFVTIVAGVV
jgi:hypothetical protein